MVNSGWDSHFIWFAQTLNDVLTAGIAITAFSLLLYALSFNLRDRVARSFTVILSAVVMIFTAEAAATTAQTPYWIALAYGFQWVGLVFLPAAYLHLSDALLVAVGKPSRGRRRAAVRTAYLVSTVFLLLMVRGWLFGPLIMSQPPAPHFQHTAWTNLFTLYYVGVILVAGVNLWRAYQQMMTRSGARRMLYLMLGATAPAMGAYPYLLYGSRFAAVHQELFWLIVIVTNFVVGALLVVMAYAVAFFGVTWPDRIVRARLLKWLLRGPVTASVTLGVMTLVRRLGENFGQIYTAAVPFSVVLVILMMEHGITLLGPAIERLFLFGSDQELILLQNIEERLLTQSDLRQFMDMILAAVRDTMHSPFAFVAALDAERLPDMLVTSGDESWFDELDFNSALERITSDVDASREFLSGRFLFVPLYSHPLDGRQTLLGLLGILKADGITLQGEQREALWLLVERAVLALEDRLLQRRIFRTLEDIQPQAEYLQKIRAGGRHALASSALGDDKEIAAAVKEALAHYWGGPKLTENPLLNLQVVQQMADEHDGNLTNALRALLRKALTQVRPEGERRFTTEWLLYNILELKFIQGQKVRDVAARLALSEADLYRKQRVAIGEVARAILEMESRAREAKQGKESVQFDGGENGKTG